MNLKLVSDRPWVRTLGRRSGDLTIIVIVTAAAWDGGMLRAVIRKQARQCGRSHQMITVGVYTISPHRYRLEPTLPGRADAYATAAVRPQVQGIIEKRSFNQVSRVDKG